MTSTFTIYRNQDGELVGNSGMLLGVGHIHNPMTMEQQEQLQQLYPDMIQGGRVVTSHDFMANSQKCNLDAAMKRLKDDPMLSLFSRPEKLASIIEPLQNVETTKSYRGWQPSPGD